MIAIPAGPLAVNPATAKTASHWPARLDVAQSVSGLLLMLFMWGHMAFVASILISKDAMWTITKFFEGYFIFGEAYPAIVSGVVAAVFTLLVLHAALALRKFPSSYRQYTVFTRHMRGMQHEDTTLWYWQVLTGFALFFMASTHLYWMLVNPDRIGPYGSADGAWSDHFWPLYVVMLFAVEIHGGIGLYRLALKWGFFSGPDPLRARRRLRAVIWGIIVFLIALGLTTLAAYVKIGIEHAPDYGERYTPSWVQESPGGAP